MSIPNVYWGETVLTATYLINRLPIRVLNGISPIKHMLSFFPSSPLMLSLPSRIFGCVAFVHSHNLHRGKLDPRAVKCIFIGYPSNKKVLSVIVLRVIGSLSPWMLLFMKYNHTLFVLHFRGRDVQVQVQEVMKPTLVPEQVQMSEPDVSIPNNSIEEQVQLSEPKVSILDNSIEDVTDNMPIALRKGKQSCIKYLISQFVCTDHLFVQHQKALKDENWVQAIEEEMEALEKNSTWEIVDRPKDKRVVGCR
ncbi:hypothetical protein CR513_27220, partial [Mucuna pruriens]